MIDPIIAMFAVAASLLILFGAMATARKRYAIHPELSRKFVHVGIGLISLSFPWLFTSEWPVVVLGVTALFGLLLLRYVAHALSMAQVLHSVGRASFGELYFPIALVAVFVGAGGEKVLFVVPILIMTLADAAAALVGVRYGLTRYRAGEGLKSAEGSIAFFGLAFLSVHLPLLLMSDLSREHTVLIACMLSLVLTILEAVAWRGIDNLLVPLGALALLKYYSSLTSGELVLRLVVLTGLAVFVFLFRHRRGLYGGALLAAALCAYGVWALGDVRWLIAPLVFFSFYNLLMPHSRIGESEYNVDAVLSVCSVGLSWVIASVLLQRPSFIVPFYISFAAHLVAVGLAWNRSASPYLSVAKAGAIFGVALAAVYSEHRVAVAIVLLLCCTLMAILYERFIPERDEQPRTTFPWRTQSFLVGVVSCLGFLMMEVFFGGVF